MDEVEFVKKTPKRFSTKKHRFSVVTKFRVCSSDGQAGLVGSRLEGHRQVSALQSEGSGRGSREYREMLICLSYTLGFSTLYYQYSHFVVCRYLDQLKSL